MTAFEHPGPAKSTTMVAALEHLAQIEAERDAAVAKIERVHALLDAAGAACQWAVTTDRLRAALIADLPKPWRVQKRSMYRDTEFAFQGNRGDCLQSLPLKMKPEGRAEWDAAVASGRLVPVVQFRLVSEWQDEDPS